MCHALAGLGEKDQIPPPQSGPRDGASQTVLVRSPVRQVHSRHFEVNLAGKTGAIDSPAIRATVAIGGAKPRPDGVAPSLPGGRRTRRRRLTQTPLDQWTRRAGRLASSGATVGARSGSAPREEPHRHRQPEYVQRPGTAAPPTPARRFPTTPRFPSHSVFVLVRTHGLWQRFDGGTIPQLPSLVEPVPPGEIAKRPSVHAAVPRLHMAEGCPY